MPSHKHRALLGEYIQHSPDCHWLYNLPEKGSSAYLKM